MVVTAATTVVVHTPELKTKAKVAAIIGCWDINSLTGRHINGAADPEPWADL